VICPRCQISNCRRSHRRGFKDYALGIAGLRPWRCRECENRFFAWAVPLPYQKFAHCSQCGNLDLQRISSDMGEGKLGFLFRKLHIPAYRCAPCRNRFFSIRNRRKSETINVVPSAG